MGLGSCFLRERDANGSGAVFQTDRSLIMACGGLSAESYRGKKIQYHRS